MNRTIFNHEMEWVSFLFHVYIHTSNTFHLYSILVIETVMAKTNASKSSVALTKT